MKYSVGRIWESLRHATCERVNSTIVYVTTTVLLILNPTYM